MNRRNILKLGVIGSVLLGGAGLAATLAGRDPKVDRDMVLRAVAAAVLDGALPTDSSARAQALDKAVAASSTAIAGLPPAAQAELAQLFGLLAAAPTRIALAGLTTPWPQASVQQISEFLTRWRFHRFNLMQSGYHALHDLVAGPWYGDPTSWAALDYPGPLKLSS